MTAHSFRRSRVAQAVYDVFAIAFAVLFICVTAASVPIAAFMLFFVSF